MKPYPCPRRSFFLVPSFLANAAVILDQRFEEPTEITHVFPPPEGIQPTYHGKFNAWTREGLMSATYGSGLGAGGSGGMLITLDAPSDRFMFFAENEIELPISDPAYASVEQLRTYVVSFDARIPAGKTIEVTLFPKTGVADMKARAEPSRILLGKVTGTGEYVRHTLPVAAVSEQSIRTFLQFLRDISLNGEPTMLVDLRWTLLGRKAVWATGDQIQLDNILLTVGE